MSLSRADAIRFHRRTSALARDMGQPTGPSLRQPDDPRTMLEDALAADRLAAWQFWRTVAATCLVGGAALGFLLSRIIGGG
jgi:hypothetical protein